MKEQFANMTNEKRNDVVKNITFEVFEQGQQLFIKGEKTNYAYLMLYGQLGFYNDRIKKLTDRLELTQQAKNLFIILKRSLDVESIQDVSKEQGY